MGAAEGLAFAVDKLEEGGTAVGAAAIVGVKQTAGQTSLAATLSIRTETVSALTAAVFVDDFAVGDGGSVGVGDAGTGD